MIDMSKAKIGDTVKFRCGGEAVISKKAGTYYEFEGYAASKYGRDNHWPETGAFLYPIEGRSMFDIIAIIPKPFDWKDVKPGMAFRHASNGTLWYYVGRNLSKHGISNTTHIFSEIDTNQLSWFGEAMQRAPEHDLVKS